MIKYHLCSSLNQIMATFAHLLQHITTASSKTTTVSVFHKTDKQTDREIRAAKGDGVRDRGIQGERKKLEGSE